MQPGQRQSLPVACRAQQAQPAVRPAPAPDPDAPHHQGPAFPQADVLRGRISEQLPDADGDRQQHRRQRRFDQREQLCRLGLTSFSCHDRSQDCGPNGVPSDNLMIWPGRGAGPPRRALRWYRQLWIGDVGRACLADLPGGVATRRSCRGGRSRSSSEPTTGTRGSSAESSDAARNRSINRGMGSMRSRE